MEELVPVGTEQEACRAKLMCYLIEQTTRAKNVVYRSNDSSTSMVVEDWNYDRWIINLQHLEQKHPKWKQKLLLFSNLSEGNLQPCMYPVWAFVYRWWMRSRTLIKWKVEAMYRTLMVVCFKTLRHHDYYYRTILEREGMINYNYSPQHGTFYGKPQRHSYVFISRENELKGL